MTTVDVQKLWMNLTTINDMPTCRPTIGLWVFMCVRMCTCVNLCIDVFGGVYIDLSVVPSCKCFRRIDV